MAEIEKPKFGVDLFSLLTVLFVGLKLTGHIDWSWVWILAPLWGQLVAVVIIGTIYCVYDKVLKRQGEVNNERD